jgi:hypothetical protein
MELAVAAVIRHTARGLSPCSSLAIALAALAGRAFAGHPSSQADRGATVSESITCRRGDRLAGGESTRATPACRFATTEPRRHVA